MGCMITLKRVKGRKMSTESLRLGIEQERTWDGKIRLKTIRSPGERLKKN